MIGIVFSSIVFLAIFLPIFLLVYFLNRNVNQKNLVLVAFSLFFYAWGEPVWVVALVFSGTMDYCIGFVIDKHAGRWQAKLALIVSIVSNLAILAAFKYSGFLVENVNGLLGLSLPVPSFGLPVGISFYTFQTMSYIIDLYKGKIKLQRSFINFQAYVTMFPQLVAGPIVRYADVEEALNQRSIKKEQFSQGATRFVIGLSKKVILANSAGQLVAILLDGDLSKLSVMGAVLGIVMFAFQIYFDFSGYTDMAIGLGKIIGFQFKENFNYPYMARSITDFWRRWHISLSGFFRDYVYIPLGGNRKRQFFNIAVVWFLTGLWHGASWNFILWGVYYGVLLILEKLFVGKILAKLPTFIGVFYSLVVVLGGWSLFYFTDFARLKAFARVFLYQTEMLYDFTATSLFMGNILLILVMIIGCTNYPKRIWGWVCGKWTGLSYAEPAFCVMLLLVNFSLLLAQTYNPFLYFRF